MLNNRFTCDGLLTRIAYFRGSPNGHFYVGIWRQLDNSIFVLKHRITIPPAPVGNHQVTLSDRLPVERGDFLGVHYPRGSEGIVVFSIPADNVLPATEMFRTLVVDAYDDELPTDSAIDLQHYSQSMESKTFALLAYLVNDTARGNANRTLFQSMYTVARDELPY